VCVPVGGGLDKIQRRRELRDAESKGKGMGEMQRAKAKGGLAGFVFRNATLGLGLKNVLFILVFFFKCGPG